MEHDSTPTGSTRVENDMPPHEANVQPDDSAPQADHGTDKVFTQPPATPRQIIAQYFREAIRALGCRVPNWGRLPHVSPLWSVAVIVAQIASEITFSRLQIDGAAQFYPASVLNGWLTALVLAWGAWWVTTEREHASAVSSTPRSTTRVNGGAVFLLAMTMHLVVSTLTMAIHLIYDQDALSALGYAAWAIAWLIWIAPTVWVTLTVTFLLFRVSLGRLDLRSPAPAVGLLILVAVANSVWNRSSYWYEDYEQKSSTAEKSINRFSHLTPEALKTQSGLLDAQLRALAPQRPGVTDVYAITYAPYSSENVFLNESNIVLQVMGERFGANERTLQLVNHSSTLSTQPWATPENLATALKIIAKIADPAEDIVFIHLTSHGSKAATLETSFWPIQIETLDAAKLRNILDDANVATRVLSVSACYSGTWVPFHQTPNTLIMTASDADHTSFGCGYKSDITFFTRAVFDEQLRSHTRSFEDAFNAARPIIEQREKTADKSDGFSNPQIFVGDAIRPKLESWVRELERAR